MRFQIFFVTRAPIIPATTPNTGGIRPPPTRNIIIESSMSTKPPFLHRMRVAAQIVTASPEKTVTIPDTLKLGISVIAGSPLSNVREGQASMMIPLGAISPWSISPGPWDAPATPAKMPRIVATAIVILPLNLCRAIMVTSAVSAVIEPNWTTIKFQSSKFAHPASVLDCCDLCRALSPGNTDCRSLNVVPVTEIAFWQQCAAGGHLSDHQTLERHYFFSRIDDNVHSTIGHINAEEFIIEHIKISQKIFL